MYLGIDVGTTAAKAILVDAAQNKIASASVAYDLQRLEPGISEIDPRAWIDAARSLVGKLRRAVPAEVAATRAIGLSGQMHSVVVLDADERPIRPAILWNDERGEAEALSLRVNVPDVPLVTGVVPTPSFTASKLLWLKRVRPEEFVRIRHILWAKDFVRHWLTGQFATDMSDAGGSQLLDQQNRCWADGVIDYVGLDPRWLPRLLEGTEGSGFLQPHVAEELGLAAGIAVAAGGGDAATGALGLGCVSQGRALISLGTGAVFVAAQETYRPLPEAVLHTFAHCVPRRWYRMAAMLNGASCLSWVARLCHEPDIESLLNRVEARGRDPGRILFQPYLRGERTPHNDVSARGAFIGLDAAADSVDLAKAVLEGVAFSLRQSRDLVTEGKNSLTFLGLIGGGSRSAFWSKMIASVLERPLALVPDPDFAAALGGARLAMVACGGAALIDVATLPSATQMIDPDPKNAAAYSERFDLFREMYATLRPFTRH